MASLTLPAGDTAGRTRRSAGSVLPGRDEAVDAVALITLTMIGVAGFRPAYGGHGYLAAGAAGVLLGLLLSHAGQRVRVPLLGVVAAGIIAFVKLSGSGAQPAAQSTALQSEPGSSAGPLAAASSASTPQPTRSTCGRSTEISSAAISTSIPGTRA